MGPTQDGTIAPIFQERLLDLGSWLEINGEAIYSTSPWLHQNDSLNPDVWYTCRKTKHSHRHPTAIPKPSDNIRAIYAIVLHWPTTNILLVKDLSTYLHNGVYKIELLGNEGLIQVSKAG